MPKARIKGHRKRKRAAILDAAAELFVQYGYDGASTEMIAERAGVSRQTIYNQFANKEALFLAIAEDVVREVVSPLGEAVEQGADLRETLLALGRRMLTTLLQPKLLGLCRITTLEAERFPELGRAVFDGGVTPMENAVASYLQEQGELDTPDPQIAARQFLGLTVHRIEFKTRLGLNVDVDGEEARQHLDAAVDTFLRAYRRRD
jgi:TetR/AcrR family transcriptional regulator, mexJK operon transcriptional repressor